jgi:hypothetical protein
MALSSYKECHKRSKSRASGLLHVEVPFLSPENLRAIWADIPEVAIPDIENFLAEET